MKGKQIASLIMLFVMMMGLLTGCGETQNTVDTSDTTNKQNSSNTEDVPTEVGDEILVAADFRRDTFYSRTSNLPGQSTISPIPVITIMTACHRKQLGLHWTEPLKPIGL